MPRRGSEPPPLALPPADALSAVARGAVPPPVARAPDAGEPEHGDRRGRCGAEVDRADRREEQVHDHEPAADGDPRRRPEAQVAALVLDENVDLSPVGDPPAI